jgi:Ni2+-binding GTPase involved in maturation of urease and hydrogenase
MKNKKLIIKVCGEIGTGKTCIAQLIEQMLSDYGVYNVVLKENDRNDNDKYTKEHLIDALNTIKDNLEIEIETIETKKQ